MTTKRFAGITLDTWLRIAAVFALAGLAMIIWSIVDPRPIPVIVSMSVGQVLGTVSLLVFLFVVAMDLRSSTTLSTKLDDTPYAHTPPLVDQEAKLD